jgi:low affinity Fe/Cu permease
MMAGSRGSSGALRGYWDRLLASDPGLGRLVFAGKGAASLASALAVEFAAATLLGATGFALVFYLFMGGMVGMMGGMALSGIAGSWTKVYTAAFFPVAFGTGMTLGALTHRDVTLLLTVFVAMTFLAVFVRRFGPAFFFYGFMGWIGYLFAALLGATFSMLPTLLIALCIGTAWVLLLSLSVLRTNAARALQRTRRSFEARVRTIALVCADLVEVDTADERELRRWRNRLHRHQSRLSEAALMIEASSGEPQALPDPTTGERLRGYTLEAQLAIDALAGSIEAIALHEPRLAGKAAEVAGLLSRRDFHGAARAVDALRNSVADSPEMEAGGWWPFYRLSESVREFESLAEQAADFSPAGLARTRSRERAEGNGGFQAAVSLMMGNLPGSPAVAREVPARGPRWKLLDKLDMPSRQALQVAVASALAVLAGHALSGHRYYWALIAVFVTFTGASTRSESVRKAIYRVLGTLVGLVAAIFLAHATAGNVWLVLVVIVGSLFCGFYLIRISYAFMIFFITIMVAQLYSVLGEFSDALLYLRLEETAIGAAIGIAVAVLFLPLSTRDTVRQARNAMLSSLADALNAIAAKIEAPRTGGPGEDGEGEREEPPDLESLVRTLDNQVRILGVVATPFARPAMWGNNGRHVRYRLTRFAAIAAHVRTIAVGLRRHELTDEPALAEVCRSLAGISSGLAGDGASKPSGGTVAERIDRIGEHLRIRLPDAGPPRHYPITRSLVQIKDLLDEIAAAMPSVRAERAGTSEDAVGPEPEAGVDRGGAVAVPAGPTPDAPAVPATPQRMLAGVVRATSGEPVAGAVVLLTNSSGKQVARCRTGGDGSYRIGGVPEGRYIVLAAAQLHDPDVTTVALRADRTARARLVLTPAHLVARETARVRAGEPSSLDLTLARAVADRGGSNGHTRGGAGAGGARGELVVPHEPEDATEAVHGEPR